MNTIKITFLLVLLSSTAFSQDSVFNSPVSYRSTAANGSSETDIKRQVWFEVRGAHGQPVTKATLSKAAKLNDVCQGYPTNWLKDYVSAEIISTVNGKKMKASSSNEILTPEQKNILASSDLGAEVLLTVKYKTQNSANGKTEIRTMSFAVTIVPDVEASFKGGDSQLKSYFKNAVINKIPTAIQSKLNQSRVKFTINEIGEIINARVTESTGDQETDRMMLDGVNKMPNWMPAHNSNGIKVKQDFEFIVANQGC
jgi:TonB family protein